MAGEKEPGSWSVQLADSHQQPDEASLMTPEGLVKPATWPSRPARLTNEPWLERLMDLYDVILCLIPVALMVKIMLCLVAEHKDRQNIAFLIDQVSSLTTYLIRFNEQLTTAFTIVFVLIFTTFLRRLALWRAQRGEYVARLEQYQTSMSLISTLRSILSLRAFDSISLGLVVLWSFYYLGSQASRNEYTYQVSGRYSKFSTAYRSASAPSAFQNASYSEYPPSLFETMDLWYGAYMPSDRASNTGSDFTGAVVVPFMDIGADAMYLPAASEKSKKKWRDVHAVSENTYSSAAGYNIWPLLHDHPNAHVVGDYNFETLYLQAKCLNWTLLPASQFLNGTLASSLLAMNLTGSAAAHKANNYTTPRQFTIAERHNSSLVVQCTCSVIQQHVEVNAHCSGLSCAARKMRYSLQPHPPENSTPFDDDVFADRFFQSLLSANQPTTQLSISFDQIDSAIDSSAVTIATGEADSIIENIEQSLYEGAGGVSVSVSKVLNTYYFVSQLQGISPIQVPTVLEPDNNREDALQSAQTDPCLALTRMEGALWDARYAINAGWIVVDFISQAILLAAAIAAFWLRKNTIAPDIFGYVSSLTRENPHVGLPDGGTALGGFERARLLKSVKVKIADVSRDGDVGRVGLVAEEKSAENLSSRKVYI